MPVFLLILKLLAPILLAVSALHLIFGVGADVMLGAKLAKDAVVEPSLSSQNRFYGVSYALYGVVLWLCAKDFSRYEPIFKAMMWVSLLAGAARLFAWAQHGAPSAFIIFLLLTELIFPTVLLIWLGRIKGRQFASILNQKQHQECK
jgi:Domain of unknown function (DUF4345)